jgi:hypothetical protein
MGNICIMWELFLPHSVFFSSITDIMEGETLKNKWVVFKNKRPLFFGVHVKSKDAR